MKRWTFLFTALVLTLSAESQGKFITVNKQQYQQGDTLSITCNLPDYKKDSIHFATLFLFIENIDTKKFWRYRYPMINGESKASLVIDSSINDGRYRLNFLASKQFFSIRGNTGSEGKLALDYSMITQSKQSLSNKLTTDVNGNFSIKGLLFQDTSYFIFSAPTAKNDITIHIRTPLDSLFVSDSSISQVIEIGKVPSALSLTAINEKNYEIEVDKFIASNTTLPDVKVTASKKKKVDLFNAQFSSGVFNNPNARIFDGLEDDHIAQSPGIFQFLQGRVAGLLITPRNGGYSFQWRGTSNFRGGSNVDVYVDEVKINNVGDFILNPSEVAMIKVYPPPAYLTAGGQNGAIAIYTKRGEFEEYGPGKNRFKVLGYTPAETTWKANK